MIIFLIVHYFFNLDPNYDLISKHFPNLDNIEFQWKNNIFEWSHLKKKNSSIRTKSGCMARGRVRGAMLYWLHYGTKAKAYFNQNIAGRKGTQTPAGRLKRSYNVDIGPKTIPAPRDRSAGTPFTWKCALIKSREKSQIGAAISSGWCFFFFLFFPRACIENQLASRAIYTRELIAVFFVSGFGSWK